MPTHDTYREQLLDLAYGELGRGEARALRAHLESCPACRAELERIGATRGAMAELRDEPAPDRGLPTLLAAAREAARGRKPRPFLPSWAWGASVGAVAAVAVVVVSVKLAGTVRSPTAQPSGTELVSSAPAAADEPATTPPAELKEPVRAPEKPAGLAAPKPAPARRPTVAAPAAADRRLDEARAERAAPARDADGYAKREEAERQAEANLSQTPGSADGVAGGAVGSAPALAPQPPAVAPAPAAPPPAATGPGRSPEADAIAADAEASQPLRRAKGKASAESKARAADAPEDPIARERRLRVAGRLRTSSVAFPGCTGESSREVEQDERGQVVKLTRRGAVEGAPFQAELFYGEDGSLRAVRYQAGGAVHEVRLEASARAVPATAGIPAWATEPRQAADAAPGAPPRCGT